jgi:hypothetical protein
MDYRKIWIKHNGDIPVDKTGRTYEIHHKDGDNYDSMYLVDDKTSPKGSELQSEYTENGIEFFVPKGTQLTWLELTEYVKTINKQLKIKN